MLLSLPIKMTSVRVMTAALKLDTQLTLRVDKLQSPPSPPQKKRRKKKKKMLYDSTNYKTNFIQQIIKL